MIGIYGSYPVPAGKTTSGTSYPATNVSISNDSVNGTPDEAAAPFITCDLRRFVQLCAKHGMYVYLRPGPWDHGEARNGGLPDWLAKSPAVRTNNPEYLAHVERLDREIAAQLNGLLWKDGGPVIGAQIENGYGQHGPGKGAEHVIKLKELLIAAGIDVPLDSVTGWPSLDFPPHDVIPVSGGYPDGFWYGSLTNLPPSMNYLFNLNRELGDMGATVPSEDPTGKVDLKHDPYFGAEEAGGMASAYTRVVSQDKRNATALIVNALLPEASKRLQHPRHFKKKQPKLGSYCLVGGLLVDLTGIEPVTS